ncbi:MAG: DUF4236 domain-containing protein [Sporolactobacillus sp.]
MGFRYNRRIKIAPGIHLNLGKRGHSWSFGKRGAGSVNYNPRTKKVRSTVDTGIKGLYWTKQSSIVNNDDKYTDAEYQSDEQLPVWLKMLQFIGNLPHYAWMTVKLLFSLFVIYLVIRLLIIFLL